MEEIADYLILHHGPDLEGRAHPKKKRIQIQDLVEALEVAQGKGQLSRELKPYHIRNVNGVWIDERREEVLGKKIDQVLKEKYQRDLERFLAETDFDELFNQHLVEVIDGVKVVVLMSRNLKFFKGSPHQAVHTYFRIKKKPFPYSPAVFMGPPETRLRRLRGELNDYDLKIIRAADGGLDTTHFGFRQSNSKEKEMVRDLMLTTALGVLIDQSVRHLGLETEQMSFVRKLEKTMNLEVAESAVVEREGRVARAMRTLLAKRGESLGKLSNHEGDLEESVSKLSGSFNLLN